MAKSDEISKRADELQAKVKALRAQARKEKALEKKRAAEEAERRKAEKAYALLDIAREMTLDVKDVTSPSGLRTVSIYSVLESEYEERNEVASTPEDNSASDENAEPSDDDNVDE